MIQSLYQIDFVFGTNSLRLLDFGDKLVAELEPKVTQAADTYAPILAPWSESVAKGGAVSDMGWGVVRDHDSHAALRGYCFSHAAAMPSGVTGTLRIAISAGDTWTIADVTILSSATAPRIPSKSFETISTYTLTGGKLVQI